MKVDVFFTPGEIRTDSFHQRQAVVIDVLRATSSIVTALENGAAEIIPASSVPQAKRIAAKFKKPKVCLCGEREGKIIPGFDLGNSPSEFKGAAVKGKTLVMATTNGTGAIAKAKSAANLYITSFLNLQAVADVVATDSRDLVLLCAGKEEFFSLEDSVCAGMFLFRLECKKIKMECNDQALAALALYKEWSLDLLRMMKASVHGKYLTSLGMKKDLFDCIQVNLYKNVPRMQKGRIVQ